jgi:hypothetical protein
MLPEFQSVISQFSFAFSKKVWVKAQLLLWGVICCPGSRTICNVLRTIGLTQCKQFHKYHRFLSRDKWSALSLSKVLLRLLVDSFVGTDQPLVFGIDETIERRWGAMITKRGIYRDAVRSSASHFVKCSGLRWMCLMLLTPLPWLKKGTWALPIVSALCPSERYWKERQQPRIHKTLMDWAAQLVSWLARYTIPLGRPVYLVGDGTYATYELMIKAQENRIGLIARMRMDARLFDFPAPQVSSKRGPKPKIGKRLSSMKKRLTDRRVKWKQVVFEEWYGNKDKVMLMTSGEAIWDSNKGVRVAVSWVLLKDPEGKLEPVLLACSQPSCDPVDMVRFFVRRWRVEVTFAEVRRHLGVETQRQWSDLAIERTTPILMAIKSITCLLAKGIFERGKLEIKTAAWYPKAHFTFSDILAAVRKYIWANNNFPTSSYEADVGKLRRRIAFLEQTLIQTAA